MVKPVVFQVVGYQNSGKTTFVSQMIALLKTEGLNVAAIKHHGHGGKPSVAENKDSTKHLESGAAASIVEGGGRLLLQAERKTWTLKEKIKLLGFFEPDVILIEGFKEEQYPKLLLLRKEADIELITKLSNVSVIVFWDKNIQHHLPGQIEIPWFHISDDKALEWILSYIKNQLFKSS